MTERTTVAPAASPATAAAPDPRRWIALALLCTAYFMIIVDSQIVILALPSIEAELSFDANGSSWVMSAYLLAFGGLLLFGGRTADLLGGRRMFMIGTALFLLVERFAKAPLVPLRVFRLRSLMGGNVMTLLVSMTIYGGALMMSVYAQQVLGYSAVLFGLSTAIYALMSVVGSNLAGPLTSRFGYKKVAVFGAVILSAGAYLLSRVEAGGDYWTDLFPAMVVFGYGIGTTVVSSAIAALSGVPAEESGLASGINNSVFQIGAGFGIALCTTVLVAWTDPSAATPQAGLNSGVQAAFTAAFVFAAACLAVAVILTLVRDRTKPADVLR